MSYVAQILLKTPTGTDWKDIKTSHGKPYTFNTAEEANDFLLRWYPSVHRSYLVRYRAHQTTATTTLAEAA
ncbi:hypothetical protein [Roseibium alexandrii]|uniref:Uncharacterized protein n=1 Tax=Roseibium alexandrii (strain DSM 17067 / NCIMB 14079 / DFL-11) TaxID=244592 RepID=A0A5E8GSF1_ROSAD|nr:hypothetical protein [Roseibium alexandrii]EEE42829.1 hypothetical protein SADFL11_PLAS1 [Roseibium alexandrii DFL-11]